MVTPEDAPAQHTPDNTGGTFGKLKQTLSSSLLTAQDKGNAKNLLFFSRILFVRISPYYSFFIVIVLFEFKNALEELIICMRFSVDNVKKGVVYFLKDLLRLSYI